MPQRETYHHGDLRSALISRGLEELEAAGVENLSLRRLAESLGVSKTAPYRHFADKSALLAALANEGRILLADCLEAPGDQTDSALVTLAGMGRAYIQFALDHPCLYAFMFSIGTHVPDTPVDLAREDRAFRVLFTTLGKAQQAGWKTRQDQAGLVMNIWALVHGIASLLLGRMAPDLVSVDSLIDAMHVLLELPTGKSHA